MAREQRERFSGWEPEDLRPTPEPAPQVSPGRGAGPQARGSAESAESAEVMVRFEPEQAVSAIVFHLLDERIALSVADGSVRVMQVRLRRRAVRPAVARDQWRAMTNRQRLDWLTAETRCGYTLVDGQVAVLGQAAAAGKSKGGNGADAAAAAADEEATDAEG
jgi:hypothetical protein